MSDTIETLTAFAAGDLVISVYGDGDGSGTYGDNQAAPIVLEEITTAGTVVGQMVLPQATTIVNGVTQYAISGEYGSSSEGSLELSADGQSLVIMGYGVNADTFNAGGAAVYGNAALAQSTSVPGGQYTPVARVVADIGYNGTVDTSTAIYNIDNTNNPRSVATVNGTTFYISGQGVKGDTTQGVFEAHDGANSVTAIDTSTDTRTVEIINGVLYVSRDSTQGSGGTSNIESYGTTLPTSATVGTALSGIDGTITLSATQVNSVDSSAVGTTIHLSPENYFFADANTLYIADGGDPKEGGLGDGGLQKWVYSNGSWNLEYTLSDGLDLVADTATSGTTGLIGLTGTVVNGVAYLYATNSTLGDTDQTYLYGIMDTLSATTGAGESFTVLETAAPDTNIRGVAFAPSAATPAAVTSTSIGSGVTSNGLTVTSGSVLDVLNGGTVVGTTVMSGGTETIAVGGLDSDGEIAFGGSELVLGSASGDYIGGVQIVSNGTAVVSNEIVVNGGSLDLFLKGVIANATTVEAGGTLNINGNAYANNTVIDGGVIDLQSAKAVLSGSLTFSGAGTIEATALSSATYGDVAVISGWGAGDVIDETVIGAGATLTTSTSGGNTIATITGTTVSGGSIVSESFTFAGTSVASNLQLVNDGGTGVEISYLAPVVTDLVVSGGQVSSGLAISNGTSVDVLNGGTIVGATIVSGGFVTIEVGGIDSGSTLSAGGNELVLGSATGDQVYGTQLVSAATAVVSNETVYAGGAVDLFLKGGVASGLIVESGGQLNISGNATTYDTIINGGTVDLESPKGVLSGSLTFSGTGTLEFTDVISAGYGDFAVISGFGAGDVIDETLFGLGTTFSTATSGGDTVATVSNGGNVETFIFAGTAIAAELSLVSDGRGGEEIIYGSATSSGTTPPSSNTIVVSGGTTSSGLTISSGFTLDVQSGGTAVATTILAGGSATIEAGGTGSGSMVSAGGSETVLGSATLDQVAGSLGVVGAVSSETILAGGTATIAGGATDTGSIIAAGGTETVSGSATLDQVYGVQNVSAATAVVSNETVYNGGTVELLLAGAIANNLTVLSGGEVLINARGTVESAVLSGGATLALESGKSTLSGTLTFDGPATLEETATVTVSSGGLFFGDMAVISGFGAGDVIDFTGSSAIALAGASASVTSTTSGGDTYATVSGGGITETFIFAGTTIGPSLALVNDGLGGEALEVACFLPGTHILTDRGEVLVEKLEVGDMIVTASGRQRPLCWIGKGSALTTRGQRTAATPLIVRKGALADNVPHRDLRITKGHSLFVDDVLIPVEFLVNHRSILWDDHAREVTVYHLELDEHDVLIADGAPAESYRDDGNRWLFRNANSGWDQPAKAPCAPVLTGGPIVDAVWKRLLDRAGGGTRAPLTEEADLHLTVDGVRVDVARREGDDFIFNLSGPADLVRIASRSVVPQELGLARDARCLGVALRQVVMRQGSWSSTVLADDVRLVDGFHQYESDNGFVWTDGDAGLPMDLMPELSAPVEVVLTVASTTRYIDDGVRLRVA